MSPSRTTRLVTSCELWKWSSIRWRLGARDHELVCDTSPGRPGEWDTWKGYQ